MVKNNNKQKNYKRMFSNRQNYGLKSKIRFKIKWTKIFLNFAGLKGTLP